ncbi:MAG: acyl-CoA dehydrogenase family protein [Thermodesulfobacteriota bacterium]
MEKEWLFDEDHRMFRRTVRKWVEAELAPYAEEWEAAGEFPDELFRVWRDPRVMPIGGGTSEIQKEIIGKLIGL